MLGNVLVIGSLLQVAAEHRLYLVVVLLQLFVEGEHFL